MSYTNKTPNYELPQYSADDKPTFLGDFNQAMSKIDTTMKNIDSKATEAETLSSNANSTASQALETAQTAESNVSSAQTNASQAKTMAQNAQTDATTAINTANTASGNASSALNTANQANSTAETASSNASSALTKANEALNKSNIVFNTVLESDQNSINIPNLDFMANAGYKIYINGTGEITNGSQGDLMTICAEVPGATRLINRMMGLQIVPTNENVMKIQNDNFQSGLVLNRFTSGLGGISESILQFRPNSGTDNQNLLHCLSNWGIANNASGSCGQITSSFRGQGLTNVTELNINAGTNSVLKAGTRITVEVVR